MQTNKTNTSQSTLESAPAASQSSLIPPDFKLIKSLGSGGGSEVSLVSRNSDNQLFALKLPLKSDGEFALQARREIQITEKLFFPAVVRAAAIKEYEPGAGLLLPYYQGQTLDRFGKCDDPIAIMNLLSALAISLYYLKLKGVAHGDFKGQNIILPVGFSEAELASAKLFYPRLIDFSMAHEFGDDASERIGIGTLGYAAPEAFDGKSLTHQSDLFSLGVVAYLLITGEHPFIDDKADPAEISAAVKERVTPPLCVTRPDFPEGLSRIIETLLAKSPALRPESAFAVCQELEKLGATYPYRKAIAPKHLLPLEQIGDVSTISIMPGFDLPARNELHRISDGDVTKLRLILDSNFRIGKLVWRDGVLVQSPDFEHYYWSNRLRRMEYEQFNDLSFSEARWLVKCAVAGGAANLLLIEEPPKTLRPAIVTPSLIEALGYELSETTVKSRSLTLANKLKASRNLPKALELCANLYVRGEDLSNGAELAIQLCDTLAKDNREVEALPLLQDAEALAQRLHNQETEIQLLHRDGDIRKDLGDLVGAEDRYLRLLALAGDTPSRILAETYKDLGDLYKLKQDYQAGLAALEKARALFEQYEDSAELARVENNLGNMHWVNSDYVKAHQSYRKALRLHRSADRKSNVANSLNNIASIYAITGRLTRAIWIYGIALKLKYELADKIEIARTLNNLGYTLYLQGSTEKALSALTEALEINQEFGSKKEALYNLNNISSCAITAGRFADALGYLRDARDIADELHDKPTKAELDLLLAKIFTRTGLWRQALRLVQRSLAVSLEIADRTLTIRCELQLAELYKRQNNSKLSEQHVQEALKISDEIQDRQGAIQALMLAGNNNRDKCSAESKNTSRKALSIAVEIKSPRDSALAALSLAEVCFDAGATDNTSDTENTEECATALGKAAGYFHSINQDLDLPRFWRLWARTVSQNSESDAQEAQARLTEVVEELHARQDRSELWLTEIYLGEVSLLAGDYERAFMSLNSATRCIKELVKELPDSQSVKDFLNQEELAKMSALIKTLRQKLNIT